MEAFLMVTLQERACEGKASPDRIVGENEHKTLANSLVLWEV